MARIIKRKIEWEYAVTPDVASFNVYYAAGKNVALDYTATFVNVSADVAVSVYDVTLPDDIPSIQKGDYTFAITAIDVNGNESDMSPKVTRFFTFVPPAAPTVVRIV